MKNVLMISAAFPPTGGPGVQRSVKFAKYLPQCGWLPTVWAAEPLHGLPRDHTLLLDLPAGVAVHRRPNPTARDRQAAPWFGLRQWMAGTTTARADHPDELIGWARESIDALLDLSAIKQINALYSTFSPASNHWLAMEIKRATGLPWVADFRDLWTDDYRYAPTTAQQEVADRALEQRILDSADAVIGVSLRQTAILAARTEGRHDKFLTITNGFDPDDFQGIRRQRPDSDKWVIAHVGRMDRWRACSAWFDGLREFIQRNADAKSRCVLNVMGHASREVQDQLRQTGVACSFLPYATHGEAIQEMLDADTLLLLVPDGPNADSVIPAKLFEYLASKRPILVVGPAGGECERIVRALNGGSTAGFRADEVTSALESMFQGWKGSNRPLEKASVALQSFARPSQARQLAAILDQISTLGHSDIGPCSTETTHSTGSLVVPRQKRSAISNLR